MQIEPKRRDVALRSMSHCRNSGSYRKLFRADAAGDEQCVDRRVVVAKRPVRMDRRAEAAQNDALGRGRNDVDLARGPSGQVVGIAEHFSGPKYVKRPNRRNGDEQNPNRTSVDRALIRVIARGIASRLRVNDLLGIRQIPRMQVDAAATTRAAEPLPRPAASDARARCDIRSTPIRPG